MLTKEWVKRFIELADHIAEWSKDPKRKVGAVIIDDNKHILSTGYNGFPKGVDDGVSNRFEDPKKLLFTEHAERNAIYTAGRNGVSLEGAKLFCTAFPCADCARGIIQSGIKWLYTTYPRKGSKWENHWKAAQEMFEEAGVEVVFVEEVL